METTIEPCVADIIRQKLAAFGNGTNISTGTIHVKKAAVLIPFLCWKGEWHVLFTRRSDRVNDHKGQVSFPGGAIDPDDNGPFDAAIREAREEIGLQSSNIEILGRLPDYLTISSFIITPVVARIEWPVPLTINSGEVSRVFVVPVRWLQDRDNFETRPFRRPNGQIEQVYLYHPFDSEQIWGISARIMIHLLSMLGLLEEPN